MPRAGRFLFVAFIALSALVTAAAKAEQELAPLLKRWQEIASSDVAALNSKLRDAKLPELKLEPKPEENVGGSNEE